MPFDGNGSYELPYDFVADRDAGFPSNRILAQKIMDTLEDLGGALETVAADAAASLYGVSTSSVAIATGSKSFTASLNRTFNVGFWLLIYSTATPANFMHGQVTSYNAGTGALVVNVTNIGGSGTLSDWKIAVSGTQGAVGATGATGPGYTATSTTSLATAGTGSKTFTTQAGLAYTIGARIRATSVGTGEWMEGLVTSYSGTSLQVTMDLNSGTGTHADWNINLAGERGEAGAGTGDVVGPASATDDHVPVFDGATGKLLKSSGVTLTDVIVAAIGASGDVHSSRQITSGAGLTGGGNLSADRTLAVGAGTGILANADDVAVDKASDANVRAAVSNKVLTADHLEAAAAAVALTETSGAVAVDWDTFINGTVTVDQATVISNPTNGQPGTTRSIIVQGNDATDRAITFGNQFLGEVPTISDCDSGRWYKLYLECIDATHFSVSSKRVKG